MTGHGVLSTPHGSINTGTTVANTFPEEFTLELVADTAKSLTDD